VVPAQGDGKNLFRTALSDADIQDGKTSWDSTCHVAMLWN
jgi:hypothetical protein